ncbi:MAG: hypothetical protein LBH46_03240 [Rickettsiales bacterium]|jgi:hypothetical protein|nr:hypothetical protein [Rickettsiales bacterium]
MWLLDEQFLYFEGKSEEKIKDITYKNEKIIREDLTEGEKGELLSFNEDLTKNGVDLIFFPNDAKCIIIELKDPKINDLNISQIDRYTMLVTKYIKEKFKIQMFYTYLITENFNDIHVPNDFTKMYGINSYFKPTYQIRDSGAFQYTEIISYTDVYKRASKRNNIFFEKLNLKEHDKNNS